MTWMAALSPPLRATQGDTVDELRAMVRDAMHCHFGDDAAGPMPKIIRLHFVRDEALMV